MTTIQMYQVLFETVSSIIEMTEYDKTLCFKYFEPVKFPKSTIVEGEKKYLSINTLLLRVL